MAVYEYEGLDAKGREVTGIIEAESPRQARSKLKGDGVFTTALFVSTVEESGAEEKFPLLFRRSISQSDLALITRQLSTLIDAGLPLVAALSSLIDQMEAAHARRVLSQVRQKVNEGRSFHDALSEHPRIFNDFFRNMVRSGEASGTLGLVLGRLADFIESQVALKRKIQAAMIYPILMTCLGAGILIYLLGSVVPQVTGIFEDLGRTLPLPTRILLALSDAVRSYWPFAAIAVVLSIITFRSYLKTPAGRKAVDTFLLKVPRLGPFLRITAMARFAKTLGTLTTGGVKLLFALEISRPVLGNAVLEEAVESVEADVREGKSLRAAMQATGQFPSEFRQMVSVGEESGALDRMLLKIADSYESRIESAVASLTALLEPLMILAMGIAVGFVVLSILLPIFDLTEALG
ncbi:type II secretion system protein GspF [bacterium]|nr:MAG: type II secretion system protein GspF [bacterium]